MKLKYYLRGLGTGVLVSTIILMISFQGRTVEMSDEEVIARARTLGMEMTNQTADEMIPKATEVETEVKNTENEEEPDTQTDAPVQEEAEQSQSPEGTTESVTPAVNEGDVEQLTDSEEISTPQNGSQPSQDKKSEKKKITFTVNRGETSRVVADRLYEAGLVDDAEKFNTYLTENDYDNFIMPGTVQIPEGAGYKKIAKILTTK